ncbi:MAG TPA: DUF934 domain-containing protein [Methylocella sp.]|nr:DUF934 domain-containing protein [Methylocella sp.]
MLIFKNDCFVGDDWRDLAEADELTPEGRFILNFPRWQALDPKPGLNHPLGLKIEPNQDLQALAPDLAHFALIAIAFPKFTDGRGYSLARQLRSYGFTGELRARGEVLFDQLQLLARCGFDSFEISDSSTLKLLQDGRRPRLGIFYQPGLGPEVAGPTRPWVRRANP